MTLGARGCAMFAGDDYVEAPGVQVAVVDTVGAGDAFAAAFVHGLASDWPAPTIADFANRAGAAVAAVRGAIPGSMKNQVQLIAYVDRLSGGGSAICGTCSTGRCARLFGGVHLLPFFHPIDGADAGFDPIDHTAGRPAARRLGRRARAGGADVDVMADVIVNHVSSQSPQFVDFVARGDASPYAGLFLTLRPRVPAAAPATRICSPSTARGRGCRSRTSRSRTANARSSGRRSRRDQIDIDVQPPARARRISTAILERLRGDRRARDPARRGRLRDQEGRHQLLHDAGDVRVHRATSRRGARAGASRCSWRSTRTIASSSRSRGRSTGSTTSRCRRSCCTRSARATRAPLKHWIEIRPAQRAHRARHARRHRRRSTSAPTRTIRDGRPACCRRRSIDRLVETIHANSRGAEPAGDRRAAANLDLYQVNCTFYDALGARRPTLPARARHPVLPARHAADLLRRAAGRHATTWRCCAHAASAATSTGTTTRRDEVEQRSRRPVVQRLASAPGLRNTHPAFAGVFDASRSTRDRLVLTWLLERDWIRLDVDLTRMHAAVASSAGRIRSGSRASSNSRQNSGTPLPAVRRAIEWTDDSEDDSNDHRRHVRVGGVGSPDVDSPRGRRADQKRHGVAGAYAVGRPGSAW